MRNTASPLDARRGQPGRVHQLAVHVSGGHSVHGTRARWLVRTGHGEQSPNARPAAPNGLVGRSDPTVKPMMPFDSPSKFMGGCMPHMSKSCAWKGEVEGFVPDCIQKVWDCIQKVWDCIQKVWDCIQSV